MREGIREGDGETTPFLCKICQNLKSGLASRNFRSHTLIHTLPLETKLQHLGLNLEYAEFLAPLFFFSTSGAEVPGGQSVKDVIQTSGLNRGEFVLLDIISNQTRPYCTSLSPWFHTG